MGPYLITFLSSFTLCWIGEYNCRRYQKKWTYYPFIWASVLIVAILAGVRDYSIGSDTLAYGRWFIEFGARFDSLKRFMKFFASSYEPGFNIFGYIVGRLFHHNGNWFLFWCAVIIYGFMMKAFWYYKEYCSVSLAWLFFLMLDCTQSLNIIRQYMAVAIAAYAFNFIFEGKYKSYIIITIIAASFHFSALFSFFIFLILYGLKRNNTFQYKLRVVLSTVIGIAAYVVLMRLLASFGGFIGAKIATGSGTGTFSFQLNPFLIRLPFLIIVLINRQRLVDPYDVRMIPDNNATYGDFFILALFVELVLSQLRGFSDTVYRLTSYFLVFKYVIYSRVIELPDFSANKIAKRVLAIVYMLIIFVYWVVIVKSANIYPYTSEILGIH